MAAFVDWVIGLVIGKGLNDQHKRWKAEKEQAQARTSSPGEESFTTALLASPATDEAQPNTIQRPTYLPILPCGSESHNGVIMPTPDYQGVHCHYTTKADHIDLMNGEPITAVKTYKHAPFSTSFVIGHETAPENWPLSLEHLVRRRITDLENLSLPTSLKMARSLHALVAARKLNEARESIEGRMEHRRRANRPAHQLPPSSFRYKAGPLADLKKPEFIASLEELNKPKDKAKRGHLQDVTVKRGSKTKPKPKHKHKHKHKHKAMAYVHQYSTLESVGVQEETRSEGA